MSASVISTRHWRSEGDFTANFKADNDLAGTGEIGIKIAINEDERYLASIVFWKGVSHLILRFSILFRSRLAKRGLRRGSFGIPQRGRFLRGLRIQLLGD